MIVEIFALLLETTLATSLAAMIVLSLRRPLRRVAGARGAYALWLLLPIAGIAVIVPARTITLALPEVTTVSIAPIPSVAVTDIDQSFDAQTFLISLWGAGVFGLGLILTWQQRRFRRALGRLRTREDGSWQAEHVDAGPAVIGLWRGRIVLPSDFESRYTELERDLVLRHERVHLARRDPLANLAAAALRCLYWFNPLLHYAVGRFRFDQELAADATVLAQRPEARRSYADAMLKTQLMFDPPPLGCHWQSAHPLKERIAMLKQPLPSAVHLAAGFVFALLLSAATGFAAWAAQPAQTVRSETSRDQGAAMVHLFRDGKRVKSAFFQGKPGQQLELSDGDLTLSFGFDDLQPDTVRVSSELMQGENLLARPVLVIKRGTSGTFGIGEMGADGHPTLGATFEVPPGAADVASIATLAQPAREDGGSRKHKPPHYPADALKRRIEGTVVLKVKVSREGRALESELDTEASTPDIDAQLVQASRTALVNWTFDPERNAQGKTVVGWISVPITFSLTEKETPSPQASPTSNVQPPPELNFGWTDQASGKLGWVESGDQC